MRAARANPHRAARGRLAHPKMLQGAELAKPAPAKAETRFWPWPERHKTPIGQRGVCAQRCAAMPPIQPKQTEKEARDGRHKVDKAVQGARGLVRVATASIKLKAKSA